MEELTIEVILHACMIDMHPDKISGGLLAEGCLKGQTLIQNKPSISEGYFSASFERALFYGLSWISFLSMIYADF